MSLHPLLDELRRIDAEIARHIVPDYGEGLGDLGLMLGRELTSRHYEWCTPLNAWTFARTGGSGVHFSLLAVEGLLSPESPVIITNPSGMGQSDIVGENLFDFLCFGARRGYFALEHLAYDLDLTLKAYTDPDWTPTLDEHYSVGFGVSEHNQRLLQILVDRLGIRPWSDASRFGELQSRLKHHIQLPPGMLD